MYRFPMTDRYPFVIPLADRFSLDFKISTAVGLSYFQLHKTSYLSMILPCAPSEYLAPKGNLVRSAGKINQHTSEFLLVAMSNDVGARQPKKRERWGETASHLVPCDY